MMIDRQTIEQIVLQVLRTLHLPPLYVLHAPDVADLGRLAERWNVVDIADDATVPEGGREAAFLGVTQDVFVKAALGLADDPAAKRISQLLRRGVRVYLVPDSEFDWILDLDAKDHPNPEYAALFAGYKRNLERFGARVVPWRALLAERSDHAEGKTPRSAVVHRKLLTEQDVRQCTEDVIYIRPSTIVTPLARDAARELGKRICLTAEHEDCERI